MAAKAEFTYAVKVAVEFGPAARHPVNVDWAREEIRMILDKSEPVLEPEEGDINITSWVVAAQS